MTKAQNIEVEKAEIEREAEILRKDDYLRRALETNIAELERFAGAFETEFEKPPLQAQRWMLLRPSRIKQIGP